VSHSLGFPNHPRKSSDSLLLTAAPPGLLTPVWLTWSVNELKAPHIINEDCLTLNIWTKPQVGESKKAVMVWIYGGSFTQGVTQDNNGQFLTEDEDVIVVSLKFVNHHNAFAPLL
jgi:carboxylesterase type B